MTNEDNRYDAEKCIDLAQLHILSGNLDKAERLALKARRLFPSVDITQLLEQIKAEKKFLERSKGKKTMYSSKGNSNNLQEAERCIEKAQTAIFQQEFDKARRMLNKAERMCPSERAKDLLRQIDGKGEPQEIPNLINCNPKPVEVKAVVKKRVTSAEQFQAMERVRNAKDSYDVLGVPRECDLKQVGRAWKALTKLLHPDVNNEPEATEIYIRVIEAKDSLTKEKKKQLN